MHLIYLSFWDFLPCFPICYMCSTKVYVCTHMSMYTILLWKTLTVTFSYNLLCMCMYVCGVCACVYVFTCVLVYVCVWVCLHMEAQRCYLVSSLLLHFIYWGNVSHWTQLVQSAGLPGISQGFLVSASECCYMSLDVMWALGSTLVPMLTQEVLYPLSLPQHSVDYHCKLRFVWL